MQPAHGVDLRSSKEMRLKVRAVLDHKVVSGFPACDRRHLAGPFGNRLSRVIFRRASEQNSEGACAGVPHAGVYSDEDEQVDPINYEGYASGSMRERGTRQPPGLVPGPLATAHPARTIGASIVVRPR